MILPSQFEGKKVEVIVLENINIYENIKPIRQTKPKLKFNPQKFDLIVTKQTFSRQDLYE